MTACPSAYVLKLICGSERGRVEREISAFERQDHPTPLSISPYPLQSSSISAHRSIQPPRVMLLFHCFASLRLLPVD